MHDLWQMGDLKQIDVKQNTVGKAHSTIFEINLVDECGFYGSQCYINLILLYSRTLYVMGSNGLEDMDIFWAK